MFKPLGGHTQDSRILYLYMQLGHKILKIAHVIPLVDHGTRGDITKLVVTRSLVGVVHIQYLQYYVEASGMLSGTYPPRQYVCYGSLRCQAYNLFFVTTIKDEQERPRMDLSPKTAYSKTVLF